MIVFDGVAHGIPKDTIIVNLLKWLKQIFWDEAKIRLLQSELLKAQNDRMSPYILTRKLFKK